MFDSPRFNSWNVIIDKQLGVKNTCFLPQIFELFKENYHILSDDYWSKEPKYSELVDQIQACNGWFFVVTDSEKDNKFAAVYWLRLWEGSSDQYQSVQLQAAIKRSYWGKSADIGCNQILKYLFNTMNLERVQMEIPQNNRLACKYAERNGFVLEGIRRNATKKDGININHCMYSILKDEFNENEGNTNE